jgi:hypothetical protein
MSPLSHALFLVLKLANLEARHARTKTITKDHLFLGLLKVVDVNLDDYFSQLSSPEQTATLSEIDSLRNTLCILDTTQTRRALRALLLSNQDDVAAASSQPVASTGYTDTLAMLKEAATEPPSSFAQSVVAMHKLWSKQCPGKQPELSECWRRLATGAVVEFTEQDTLRLMFANHCLVQLPAGDRQARAQVFGASLAAAFDEFEANAGQKPCRVPLAEF